MTLTTKEIRELERERAIPPTKLAHVVLRTARFREMRDWYLSVLAAKPVHENDRFCFMTYDDEHHRIALVNTPDVPDKQKGTAGVDHIAFTYADLGALMGSYARLKSIGIEPYWCINHGGTTSIYYCDPDNNQIEFQVDNFSTAEEIEAFVNSPLFRENPIGVEFDPEKLIARYEQGDAIETLLQQGATD